VKKIFFCLAIQLILISASDAQTIYHPWIFEGGTNFTDFHFTHHDFATKFQSINWMGKKAPTMIRLGRMVKPYLTVSAIWSTTTLETKKLNDIPLQKEITADYFWKAGLQFEYKFTNGKLLKEDFFIDPYIYTGFNMSTIDDKSYPGIPGGIGLNIWPLDYFGLNIQGSYEYVFDFDNYMHYSLGLVVRFGDMLDKDKDRIPDRYDACPKIFGLGKFMGCPDYDYDGVVDSLDRCPREYGYAPSGGCPDYDKDGVPDKTDLCPCRPGSKENQGCPESIQYSKPTEDIPVIIKPPVAEEEIAVLPQIAPQEIEVSEEPIEELALEEKKPSPVPDPIIVPITNTELVNEAISKHLNNIRFKSNSATLLSVSYQSLDEILNILEQNQEKQFIVVGYSDDSESTEYNHFLSMERAKSVIKYFVEKGFIATNIEPGGFGNTNPADDEGNLNRRVEIYTK